MQDIYKIMHRQHMAIRNQYTSLRLVCYNRFSWVARR
jgi:hypothetical protein